MRIVGIVRILTFLTFFSADFYSKYHSVSYLMKMFLSDLRISEIICKFAPGF